MTTYNQDEVRKAFEVIKSAMIADGGEPGSYAHAWHCNIAMACFDAIKAHDVSLMDLDSGEMSDSDAHEVGNDAATRFMSVCFGVNTGA